ncbi:MAG: GNAT family N-acetyltransferase [Pirellulales bacterium]
MCFENGVIAPQRLVIRIRALTTADLGLAMRLKAQAGWNQLEGDWQRFLFMQPDGCFVAEWDRVPVGTAVACIFDEVAWLAMVLVDVAARGRGVGTALVRHALAFLDRAGVRCVRLDATPLGQPLYQKLGFVPEYAVARYEGVLSTVADEPFPRPAMSVVTAGQNDYERLCALDCSVVGADRQKFLVRLFHELPEAVRLVKKSGEIEGYLTARPGSEALQIGPCVAAEEVGATLLADAAWRYAGQRVVLDVPLGNAPAVRLAQSLRLNVGRSFVRMRRGPAVGDDLSRLWASSGPELG